LAKQNKITCNLRKTSYISISARMWLVLSMTATEDVPILHCITGCHGNWLRLQTMWWAGTHCRETAHWLSKVKHRLLGSFWRHQWEKLISLSQQSSQQFGDDLVSYYLCRV